MKHKIRRRLSVLRAALLVAGLGTAAAGCEQATRNVTMSTPPNPSIRLAVADAGFRLTPTERASIRVGFDVDALERLLAAVEPGVRPWILENFQEAKPGGASHALVKMGDPTLQPLLDEIWAPVWDLLPPDAIDKDDSNWPGRELARKRRQERRSSGRN